MIHILYYVMYFCDGKADFLAAITPAFIVLSDASEI